VFESRVSVRARWVECPACGGRNVHVLPPVKILDLRRTPHYNQESQAAEEERGRPPRVLRATVPEPVYVEDVEIVEEEIG